jgi:heterodisulfide reductase subunit C2
MTIRRVPWTKGQQTLQRVADISGQNVYRCMQCGTCTAVCPMSLDMDITPRHAVLMLQHEMADEVLASRTAVLCASCHSCQVRCPRAIELPRIMEALRQVVLRGNVDLIQPRRVPAEELRDAPQMAWVACFRKLTA